MTSTDRPEPKPKPHAMTEAEKAQARALIESGLTLSEVGRRLGRARKTVRRAMMGRDEPNGCRPKPTVIHGAVEARVLDLLDQGLTVPQIAEEVGVRRTTLQSWLEWRRLRTRVSIERETLPARIEAALRANPNRTDSEIGKALGCHRDSVLRVRQRLGIAPPRQARPGGNGPSFAHPVSILDKPDGRIQALRRAHGIEVP